MVAQQTTEFAPGPLFGNQLKAAVAGVAVGTGVMSDFFILRICACGGIDQAGFRYLRSANDLVQRSRAQQAALSDK
jgi:hypothetical protein